MSIKPSKPGFSPPDRRASELLDWAGDRIDCDVLEIETISSDASFRRYFRIAGNNRSRVVMDAPPQREALDAFVDIADRLAKAGLNVPEILAEDRQRGFLLLGDLGSKPWHQVLDEHNCASMFADAIRALITMQTQTDVAGLPEYDAALLLSELSLFPDWFLARHWNVEPTETELDDWEMLCMTLIRWALDQPRVFVHRDFMPRNLMLAEPNPGILDFQDAVLGPISYDPVCLFRDAFLSWPPEHVDGWLENYRRHALDAGLPVPADPQLWKRTCDLMGAQRHLKVLGIFARIRYRDGKPRYLQDASRFFSYLNNAIQRNPELVLLERLLGAWRVRARFDD
ncbi:MAG: phosphotransferase [Wenzhouxiangellaceae bacterium]|nr:phosphotransferase [Wenzhouxiangellaceae bacterium]